MKQKTSAITTLVAAFLLSAFPSFAQIVRCGRRNQAACTLDDIYTTAASIAGFLIGASSIVAILFIVIGGIKLIFAAGNSKQIEEGKQTLFNAILGLVIVLAAYLIVNVVLSTLTDGAITLNNIRGFWR